VGDVLLTVAGDQSQPAEAEFSQTAMSGRQSSYQNGLGVEIITGLAAQIDGVMNVRDADAYITEVRISAASIPDG
jgi:hypothetical protein